MNYRNPHLLDELAAQYALGTLRGLARARFARLCRESPAATSALHRWEDRFMDLAREIEPIEPPAYVWKKVQQRLGHARNQQSSGMRVWWNSTRLTFASGIAVIALGIALWALVSTYTMNVVATFADHKTELWRIEARGAHEQLVVTRSTTLALDALRDYELWALPDSGSAPVSLGLMPKYGKRDLALSAAQRIALAGASKIAISLEPLGGSSTGAPTGPVLFVTTVIRAG